MNTDDLIWLEKARREVGPGGFATRRAFKAERALNLALQAALPSMLAVVRAAEHASMVTTETYLGCLTPHDSGRDLETALQVYGAVIGGIAHEPPPVGLRIDELEAPL